MGLLDEIIGGSTDDSVSTSNLLRKVQVASHYLGADEIKGWAQRELRGYADDDHLPDYRAARPAPVMGTWVSHVVKITDRLEQGGLPDEAAWAFEIDLRQSLAELEQLAGGETDAEIAWPGTLVVVYNSAAARGLVPQRQGAALVMAHRTLTRGTLFGVIDTIRNTALEFALSLQDADPAAGSPNGPTIESSPVREAVIQVTNHIYGDGANVAQGTGITQTSTLAKGDLSGLVHAVQQLVKDPEKAREAVAIITGEGTEPEKRSKLQRLGAALGSGATSLAGGVVSNVVASGLIELAGQYLGW